MEFKDYNVLFKLNKGFSGDEKYCIEKDNTKYLLRLSKTKSIEYITNLYNFLKQINDLDIPICKTIEIGEYDNKVYWIQEWIEGVDLREVIENIPLEKQYDLGFDAGMTLKKLHSIKLPDHFILEPWNERYNRKIDLKIKNYNNCHLKYNNGELFINYLQNNRHLLDDRPNSFQHGDYHIGNFMLDKNNNLVIIDFEGYNYGDPWEEFDRLVWCTEKSPKFAKGMVDGYFNNQVPIVFFKTILLYISNNILSSLPWAVNYGEEQIEIMKNLANNELKFYKNFTTVIPTWYNDENNTK